MHPCICRACVLDSCSCCTHTQNGDASVMRLLSARVCVDRAFMFFYTFARFICVVGDIMPSYMHPHHGPAAAAAPLKGFPVLGPPALCRRPWPTYKNLYKGLSAGCPRILCGRTRRTTPSRALHGRPQAPLWAAPCPPLSSGAHLRRP